MKVTYTGTNDARTITGADFPDREDDFVYEWTPGSWNEVPDDLAQELIERSREFVPYEDPKNRDHRTKEELYAVAQELEIEGRSTMDREQLLDAVYSRQSEVEGEPEGEPHSDPIVTQDDTPDRA